MAIFAYSGLESLGWLRHCSAHISGHTHSRFEILQQFLEFSQVDTILLNSKKRSHNAVESSHCWLEINITDLFLHVETAR
jgi:hypothetical protein